MPTLSSLNIPTPKSWDEFEDICLSSFKLRWSSPTLVKHGRQGQPQNGVDIFGEDNLGLFVGIQCKIKETELTEMNIMQEIAKAEKFNPKLRVLYFATTAPSDVKIQSIIRLVSANRVSAKKFPIGIFFWNDIIQELANNEAVFAKHFPQLNIKTTATQNGQRKIAILDLVYYGVNFSQSMQLLFGFGFDDPNELSIVCNVLECSSMQIMTEEKQQTFSTNLKYIEDYVLPWVEGKENREEGWPPVNKMVKKIEREILGLQYQLSDDELIIFQLSLALANWDRTAVNNRKLKQADEDKIIKLTHKLYGGTPKEIKEQLKMYRAEETVGVVNCPFTCYQICKNRIIEKQLYK